MATQSPVSVEELLARAAVNLLEHVIELVPALEHALDELRKSLAHPDIIASTSAKPTACRLSAVTRSVAPRASLALVLQPWPNSANAV